MPQGTHASELLRTVHTHVSGSAGSRMMSAYDLLFSRFLVKERLPYLINARGKTTLSLASKEWKYALHIFIFKLIVYVLEQF